MKNLFNSFKFLVVSQVQNIESTKRTMEKKTDGLTERTPGNTVQVNMKVAV